MDLSFNKILIFGIDSFTGKHLSIYLINRKFDVYGTSLFKKDNKIFKCDILNKDDIKQVLYKVKPNYILNLSAISFVESSNKELFYKVNVLGVENILEVLYDINLSELKKLIFVSSAVVYGKQNSEILYETMCPNPINHYGMSKLIMEQIIKNYYDKFNIIITRPFNYTGKWQDNKFLIPKIVNHYQKKQKIIELGNIEVYREFNDIYYVCEAYYRLLMTNIKSEIFNISSERIIALKDVLTLMDKIAAYNIKVKVNKKYIRNNEIALLKGSVKKLYKYIGKIEQIPFENTLKEMYESEILND